MTDQQAIQILEHALNEATKKGTYSLTEAAQILAALQTIKSKQK